MPRCCVLECKNRSGSVNIRMYKFPNRSKSPKRFDIWRKRTNRKDFTPLKNSAICSVHFEISAFNQSDLIREKLMPNSKKFGPRLMPGALPTLLLKGKDKNEKESVAKQPRISRYEHRQSKALVNELLTIPITSKIIGRRPPIGTEHTNDSKCQIDNSFYYKELINPDSATGIGIQCELGMEIYRKYDVFDSENSECAGDSSSSFHTYSDYSESDEESSSDDIVGTPGGSMMFTKTK